VIEPGRLLFLRDVFDIVQGGRPVRRAWPIEAAPV